MYKTLKIHGEPILNFWDLTQEFSPIELYQQLESFVNFAAVHCLPIPLQTIDAKTGEKYNTKYLTKKFWLTVLRRSNWTIKTNVQDTFREIIDETIKAQINIDEKTSDKEDLDEEQFKEISQVFEKELCECKIYEKLKSIEKFYKDTEQQRMVICLLVICELSEIDVLKTEDNLWKESNQNSADNNSIAQEKAQGTGSDISLFTYEKEAFLPTGNDIYRYWYHESDVLEPETKIHTVKIEAKGSLNQYATLKIELYRETDKKCIQRITLKKGEWRYCNVANGKIIKFLPSISLSDDLCLMREQYSASAITVISRDAESWSVDADGTSCFSAGSKSQGFLLVQNGKANYNFYKAAEDYFTKLQLDMVTLPVVEANITENGYRLLLEDGSVASNEKLCNTSKRVSLTTIGRLPLLKLPNDAKCFETVVSDSQKSIAFLTESQKKEKVIFQTANIDMQEKDGYIEVHF